MTDSKRVALFVTCLVDQILPEVGVSAVNLIRQAGYEVVFPEAQTCCGQPFFNSGFQDEARRLAQRMIAIFEPYELVVAPSGSCAAFVRAEYPQLFQDDPELLRRARALAAKTYELSEFLIHVAGWQPEPKDRQGVPVTYHDSCHMNRMLHIRQEPRALLTAAGYTIDEMSESDRCCGFGGIFSVHMPEISNAMTEDKLHQAEATSAPLLVTSDPGCLMQMRGLTDGKIRIQHLATLLDESVVAGDTETS
ncbi:MAG: (Fe-S)-binding protein [Chloroflexota bacterium]|nr:(Fe-S)-binding protein [Chloroflexota bacterium]